MKMKKGFAVRFYVGTIDWNYQPTPNTIYAENYLAKLFGGYSQFTVTCGWIPPREGVAIRELSNVYEVIVAIEHENLILKAAEWLQEKYKQTSVLVTKKEVESIFVS